MSDQPTSSAHIEHCFCKQNTGGQPRCCHCGTVRVTMQELLTTHPPVAALPDPARAEFVARVREEYREGWTGKGATPLKRIMWVLEEVPATYEYVRLHGWPSTLRAIAEALDEDENEPR